MLDRLHHKFHKNMVTHIAEDMNEEELEALLRGLKNLHKFLEELM
ncbi:Transcriptional regulator of fattyacid biosynthesis FabT [Streptococcus sp. HSISB1]|nr:Transcriptional regulator of fattyacid biosynthesis FabT [Streptococcus sp. HSISB1]